MEWTRFSVLLGETLPKCLSPITTLKWLSGSSFHCLRFIENQGFILHNIHYPMHTCSVLDKYYVGELVDNEFPVFPEMG